MTGQLPRKLIADDLDTAAKAAFGPDAYIGHINWGDGHRRMMLWNRRFERALRRSLRNQPPRQKGQR